MKTYVLTVVPDYVTKADSNQIFHKIRQLQKNLPNSEDPVTDQGVGQRQGLGRSKDIPAAKSTKSTGSNGSTRVDSVSPVDPVDLLRI